MRRGNGKCEKADHDQEKHRPEYRKDNTQDQTDHRHDPAGFDHTVFNALLSGFPGFALADDSEDKTERQLTEDHSHNPVYMDDVMVFFILYFSFAYHTMGISKHLQ